MKNTNRKNILNLITAIALPLALASCSLFTTPGSDSTDSSASSCALTITVDSPISSSELESASASRTAFPSAVSNITYSATITNTDDSSDTKTANVTKDSSDNNAYKCTFTIDSAAQKTYTVSATGTYTKDSTAYNVLAGSYSLTIDQYATVSSATVSLSFNSAVDKTNWGNATGSVSLKVSCSPTVKGVKVLIGSTTITPTVTTSNTATTFTISKDNLAADYYDDIRLDFYSDTECTSTKYINSHYDTLIILPGQTTDTWYVNGTKKDTLTISDSDLQTQTVFVVQGSSDSANSLTTYTPDKAANDSNRGTVFAPLATVAAAVAKCTASGKTYTIYVDGTTSETEIINACGKTITISAFSQSTGATIKRNYVGGVPDNNTIDSLIYVSSGTLNMSGITLDGNKSGSSYNFGYYGGGIRSEYSTISLEKCIIQNCKATKLGGGICTLYTKDSITLDGCTIKNCYSGQYGGAVSSAGALVLKNGTVIGSTKNVTSAATSEACSNYATNGGGIYIASGTFAMSGSSELNSVVSYNYASTSGGGIYYASPSESTSLVGSYSSVQYNGTATNGGGIYFAGTSTTASGIRGTVSKNKAACGGGLYIDGSTINFYNGEISGNSVAASTNVTGGGGIYLNSGALNIGESTTSSNTPLISGNTVSSSKQYCGGGGIYIKGGTFILNKGIIGTQTNITTYATSTSCSNTTFASGNYSGGGGIYIHGGSVTFNGGIISYNYSEKAGGGIMSTADFNPGCLEIIYNGTSDTFNGSSPVGGGIAIGNKKTLTINNSNCTIRNNFAYAGGGIGIYAYGTINLSDGFISINYAKEYGAGIYIHTQSSCILNMSGGTISSNSFIDGGSKQGSGIYVGNNYNDEDPFTISSAANINGNDVYLNNSKIKILSALTNFTYITPANYSTGTQVLAINGFTSSASVNFIVTPQVSQYWEIDGSTGCLKMK